jgi:hypothetical protein
MPPGVGHDLARRGGHGSVGGVGLGADAAVDLAAHVGVDVELARGLAHREGVVRAATAWACSAAGRQ